MEKLDNSPIGEKIPEANQEQLVRNSRFLNGPGPRSRGLTELPER